MEIVPHPAALEATLLAVEVPEALEEPVELIPAQVEPVVSLLRTAPFRRTVLLRQTRASNALA